MASSDIVPDITVTLDLDEQVLIRLALNDRLQWLKRIGIPADDKLSTDTVALLAKLNAIPVLPV